jgi:hypothetical protein
MTDNFWSLLPPRNTEPKEAVVERTSGERWDGLDVDVIRRSRDPWRCPAHLLPYLAHDFSVDIWHDEMSETDKRLVVARAIEMHRIKGTYEGLRQYIDFAGGELIRSRVPPEGIYLDEGPTDEQRAAWLSRFAQVRIRRTAPQSEHSEEDILGGDGDIGCFLGGVDGDIVDDGTFLGLYQPEPAYDAVFWDNGTETALTKRVVVQTTENATAVVESYFMQSVDRDAFLDEMCFDEAGIEETFLDEPSPVIHFNHKATADTSYPVFKLVGVDGRGDFRFVYVEPESVRETTLEEELFLDEDCLDDGHFAKNSAHMAIYNRWHVYDEQRSGPIAVVEGCFLDDPDLFGLEPFHALVDVKALDIYGVDAGFLGDMVLDDAWLDEPTYEIRQRVLDAAVSAKALRDKYLISTARYRPVRWSDRLPWGFRWDQLTQE